MDAICLTCQTPFVAVMHTARYCQECRTERHRAAVRARYIVNAANKVCTGCGGAVSPGALRCVTCLRSHVGDPVRIPAKCLSCGEPLAVGHAFNMLRHPACKSKWQRSERKKRYDIPALDHAAYVKYRDRDPQHIRDRAKVTRDALKKAAFQIYGKQCACCGEGHHEFLAIDHINGGGNQHRKEIGIPGGSTMYAWLKKEHYPLGYRTLCHNCNNAIGSFGHCPHEKAKP